MSSVFFLQGRIVSNNSVPSGASPLDGQVFHIREEGGLERWFNLTITNVGIEVRVARRVFAILTS